MFKHFVFKIHQEERIQLLHKVVLTLQKTTKEMEILFSDYSMIPLKVEITVQEKETFTV